MEHLEQRQGFMPQMGQVNINILDSRQYAYSQVDLMRQLMSRIDRKLNDLISTTHQDAVKFNSFGFWRVEEANAWIEANSPDQKFGLIIDAHMVF
jgi:hypothetical protein